MRTNRFRSNLTIMSNLQQVATSQQLVHFLKTVNEGEIAIINNNSNILQLFTNKFNTISLSSKDFIDSSKGYDTNLCRDVLGKILKININRDLKHKIINSVSGMEGEGSLYMVPCYSFMMTTLMYYSGAGLTTSALCLLGSAFFQYDSLQPLAFEGEWLKASASLVGTKGANFLCAMERCTTLPIRFFARAIHNVEIIPEHDKVALEEMVRDLCFQG